MIKAHGIGSKKVLFIRGKEITSLLEVSLYTLKPGEKVEKHFHKTKAESYYILKGIGLMNLDDKLIELSEGVHVYVPESATHSIINSGKSEFVFTIHHLVCD